MTAQGNDFPGITPEVLAPEVPGRMIGQHYVPPMRAWRPREAAQFRHGGNRPPFRARIITGCGDSIDLIPVMTLYTQGASPRWECYVPEDADVCPPFTVDVDGEPGRDGYVHVHIAADRDELSGEIMVWPAEPRLHTPN